MTRELFDKAEKLKHQIDGLLTVDAILNKASSGGNWLAAINFSEDCCGIPTIINKGLIPEDLLQDFRKAIATRVLKLDKEFEAL